MTVPQAGAQATPFCAKVQATPRFVASFVTVAETCCVFVNATADKPGDMEIEIGSTFTGTMPEAVLLVTETAWRFASPGAVPGAV